MRERLCRAASRALDDDEETWDASVVGYVVDAVLAELVVDAVLAELREPDAAMVEAAYDVPTYWMHDVTEYKPEWHDEFRQTWRATIDAISGGEGR